MVGLTQSPAVGDDAISHCDARIGGCLDRAGEVDTWDQGKLTNDFSPPANSKRVFIVYGRIIHRDGNVSRHKLLLVHFDHFGRNLLACLFCQQCLERHRRVLDWRFALQRPKGAPLLAQEGTFKADTIIYGG